MLLLVGAYTIDMNEDAPGKARGIAAYDFSPRSGELEFRGHVEENNPSYLTVDASRRIVYAVRECPEGDGAGITAYRLHRGARNRIGAESLGYVGLHCDHPCHVSQIGDTLLASCYTSGSVHVVHTHPDGSLGDHRQRVLLDTDQQQAHAHCEAFDARRGRVYVCDLGNDCLRTFRRDASGELTELPELEVAFDSGSGPRHGVLHPNGDYLLVNCEHRGRVALLDLRGAGPELILQAASLPERAVDRASGAAIRIDARGRNVYVSERNFSVVSVLRLELDGKPRLYTRDTVPSGGERPRDLLLSPDGKWMLTANLKDHSIGVFRVGAGGAIQLQRVVKNVKSPTSLAWMPGI